MSGRTLSWKEARASGAQSSMPFAGAVALESVCRSGRPPRQSSKGASFKVDSKVEAVREHGS